MEVVLEEFKAGRYPNLKQDLAKRKLKKGVVSYEFRGDIQHNDEYFIEKFLLPLHEMLADNEDYKGGNIILFVDTETSNTTFGVLFNKINDWDALPDDMWFKHGRKRLVVKNITAG